MNKFKRTSINDVRFLFWYYAALYAVQKYRKLFRGKKNQMTKVDQIKNFFVMNGCSQSYYAINKSIHAYMGRKLLFYISTCLEL